MPFNTQVLRKTAPWVGGGIGAGLLGTLLSRASNVQYENPDIMEEFKDFGHIADKKDPVAFIRDYVEKGHRLMQNRGTWNGKPFTAYDVMRTSRELPPAAIQKRMYPDMPEDAELEAAFDPSHQKHYKAFVQSPEQAFRKVMSETYRNAIGGQDPLKFDLIDAYKDARGEALRSLARHGGSVTPTAVQAHILKALKGRREKLTKQETKLLAQGIARTEGLLQRKNPQRYSDFLTGFVQAARNGNQVALNRLHKMNERLVDRVYPGKPRDLADRVYTDLKNEDPDVVSSLATIDAARRFRPFAQHGYSMLYPAAQFVQGMGHAGNALQVAGLGLLLKPVLGVPGSIAAATGLGAYKTLRKIQKDKMPATMPEDAPTAWESTQP